VDKYYKLDAERLLSTMRVHYEEIGSRFTYLTNRENELNGAQGDILHYIEFDDVNVVKGYNLYKKLQEIRIERRIVKDELEEVSIAYEAVRKLSNEMNIISKAQGQCKRVRDKSTKKTYSPRANNITGIDNFPEVQKKYADKLESMIQYKGGNKQ